MTMDEAIKVLETFHDKSADYLDAVSANAFALGIEALKRIRDFHEDDELLPGETDEQ